jgi:mono/diheme cytochrome c family protein
MKKINLVLILMLVVIATFISCNDKRHPNRNYMPDMGESRAYEAYSQDNLKQKGINYLNYPVEGTIKRGDLSAYTLPNDSNGYNMSVTIKNPMPALDTIQMLEAQRLYNINCAICHGVNMDAQGPLGVSGKVGGIANLKLDQYIKQPVGQMFHVVTYGKGNMGPYSSQLDKKQRWMVVQYVKSEQLKAGASKTATPAAGKDSAATAKK